MSGEQEMSHARSLDGVLDKIEITEVINAYCLHFDRAEADAVIAQFTEDATVDYGPDVSPMVGVSEFGPMIKGGLAGLFAATSHHVSNISIQFQGQDSAASICYLYAWHRYLETNEESELWGQYHHEFRRTPDGWKISRLVLRAAGMKNFHRENMHPIGRKSASDPP